MNGATPARFWQGNYDRVFSRVPTTLTGQVCRQPPMFANRIVRYLEILISEELGRSTLLSEAINSFKISAFFPMLENVNECYLA